MEQQTVTPTRKSPWIATGVIASIVLLFWVLLTMMPKGFKTTHEDIGMGKVAVVFVYDPNLAVSNTQTEQMNEARDHLGDNVVFLLARVGDPDGEKLIAKHNARTAELLLFDSSGSLVERQFGVVGANQLMLWVRR